MCNQLNGTHACQNPDPKHQGKHYSYYVNSTGKLCVALWRDKWGPVQAKRVPIALPVVK